MLERFADLARPGALVFDVGANVGIYTLLAARKGARVVAFEPSSTAARLLREHLRLNGLPATVIEQVITDGEHDVDFFEQGSANTSSISRESAATGVGLAAGKVEAVRRTATTLDLAASTFGSPDVVKLDVEGAELLALTGARDWLERRAGVLLLEVHPWSLERLDASEADVIDLLWSAGWAPCLLDENPNTRHYVVTPA